MPRWRNWLTRTTQNRVDFIHVGSTPTRGTNQSLGNDFLKIFLIIKADKIPTKAPAKISAGQ